MKFLICVDQMSLIGLRFELFYKIITWKAVEARCIWANDNYFDSIGFDLIGRQDVVIFQISKRITSNDLIRSGQGHVVINILSDLNGFWSYENREMIFAEANDENDVWSGIIQHESFLTLISDDFLTAIFYFHIKYFSLALF